MPGGQQRGGAEPEDRRAAPDSGADQLARLTRLPAVLWVGVFLLVDVGALLLGGWWLLG